MCMDRDDHQVRVLLRLADRLQDLGSILWIDCVSVGKTRAASKMLVEQIELFGCTIAMSGVQRAVQRREVAHGLRR